VDPQPIKPGYVRVILKNALMKACLDRSITIHALRHSSASHLLENGESILDVQKRLGHVRLSTTMVYLHVADIEPQKHVRLIDTIFPPKKK
jgi:site-specific recombinase XerD